MMLTKKIQHGSTLSTRPELSRACHRCLLTPWSYSWTDWKRSPISKLVVSLYCCICLSMYCFMCSVPVPIWEYRHDLYVRTLKILNVGSITRFQLKIYKTPCIYSELCQITCIYFPRHHKLGSKQLLL